MISQRVPIRPVHWGIAASFLAALCLLLVPQWVLERPRELFFDALTQIGPQPEYPAIVVVDIDRKSQESVPGDGWSRNQTAQLVRTLANASPAAIAFDQVFSSDCDPALVENQVLANALARAPAVLGFLVGPKGSPPPQPKPPLAVLEPLRTPASWFIEGAETSCAAFEEQATSAAATFLLGDRDARVRRVGAYAILGNDAYPTLAVEAVRLSQASTPILGGTPLRLRLGSLSIDLEDGGGIRFVASNSATIARRTISAAEVLDGKVAMHRIAGKILFVGSSSPILGGLRPTASMPLEPSLQIHADVANGLMTGSTPLRSTGMVPFESLYVLLGGIVIALAANHLRPVATALLGLGVILSTLLGAYVVYATTALLTDGFSAALGIAFVLAVAVVAQFAYTRRVEAVARQRFSQFLPKSVVSRYLDTPGLKRIAGEDRPITVLTTDVEGFSNLTRRTGRRELVDMLDTYFAEVTKVATRHGGMVDKIVGDSVHALFNAPEDLENHVTRAIECAQEIVRLTEEMRNMHPFIEYGFGRTRIGIETGTAILGEVGRGGKIDFTAYGDAVNIAARLEQANKTLGTSICIGPEAARQAAMPLHRLGSHEIRGYGRMELFTPVPS
ncbi:adenylate/guanylate cyclase domain-containing protein [Rhizobiaceae bacterium n13]|uniref:Adenylate/guanylate cyclase domain-containing protein n=1 Tax=Ferirhizobium litorale TaxID=2927786 RepID=A0AAE3QEJ8_9HYPH|nr:adenylate/guanylate cyclase domain-containing protein [Fererhizobium litorale]MDI7862233.1 adenylate/guanylate cyclase domain-containing protein [Fererhizobium litorale]MDI7922493.1 adenylate/guanylate cyclase domain-containing protein [Fererhizobium litorale]